MNLKLKQMLSVCILGDIDSPGLKDCIEHAIEFTDRIILIDPDSSKDAQSMAADLGVLWADLDTLASVVESEWILFVHPNEQIKILSSKKLCSQLNSSQKSCRVYVKDKTISTVLKEYQFIKNLGQFDRIGDLANITKVGVRLARRSYAKECLKTLLDPSSEIAFESEKVVHSLFIETVFNEQDSNVSDDPDEHDKRCLKGELEYGPAPGEELDEISSAFIGFRVLHKGYLNGFMESAHRGFGIDAMYLSMIEYLNKNGNFKESKELFEIWLSSRIGERTAGIYSAGGVINAHLFLLDEAITFFEKAAEISPEPSLFANAGKLCLVNGQREKAVELFKKSIETEPDSPEEQFLLSLIDSEDWRPLTLSLCMIAKDEESGIGKTLESMQKITDEIIVVDTGSADRTKEIVKEYGGRVIEYKWHDDFSAARNVALKEANCDYVLFLDADEFIDVRDRIGLAIFKKTLSSKCNIAYRVKVVPDENSESLSVALLDKFLNQVPTEQQIRIFPRRSTVTFTGTVFESVEPSLSRTDIEVKDAQLFKITHDKEDAEARDKRKIPAVDKAFASLESPEKAIEAGLFFLRFGDLKKAYQWFEKIEKADPKLMAKIATLYARQNLYDCARKIINKALYNSPDSPEIRLALAEMNFKEDRYNEVLEVLYPCILSENEDMQSDTMGDAFYYFATALLETEHIAEGINYICQALEINPLDVRYQIGGLHAFAKAGQWEDFFEVLDQIISLEKINKEYEINDFSDVGFLMLDLVQYFIRSEKQAEASACRRVLEYLIRASIVEQGEVEKMMNQLNENVQSVSI